MPMSTRSVSRIGVNEVFVGPSRRAINESAVEQLISSMLDIGLQHPITVRHVDRFVDVEGEVENAIVLVAGRHRLEAARRLKWKSIDCMYQSWDERQARMWEIAENLHRADLTKLERDLQVAEWIKLAEEPEQNSDDRVSRQSDAKLSSRGRDGEGRPESGVSKAARELGLSEPDARRAKLVAEMPTKAHDAARELGLDNNRSVLIEAGIAARDGGDAVAVLRSEHERREKKARLPRKKRTKRAGVEPDRTAEDFAESLKAHYPPSEIPTIISWLEGTKIKAVIAALRESSA